MFTKLGAINLLLLAACTRIAKQNPEIFASEEFLRWAFTRGECAVNAYSAVFFILAPSFTAHELAPHFDAKDPVFSHPALRLCLRLFGSTEILVAGVFAFVLDRANATTFLPVVLAGDVAHYISYALFCSEFPAPLLQNPGLLAHLVTMTAVIHTKTLYLTARHAP